MNLGPATARALPSNSQLETVALHAGTLAAIPHDFNQFLTL